MINSSGDSGCVSCAVLQCSDSVLSITGNVIGILTFMLAAFGAYVVFLKRAQNSGAEIRRLMLGFDMSMDQLRSLHEIIELHTTTHNDGHFRETDKRCLRKWLELTESRFYEVNTELQALGVRSGNIVQRDTVSRLNITARWMIKHEELSEKLKTTQSLIQDLQLYTILLQQTATRQGLAQVNQDQIERSNVLYDMMRRTLNPSVPSSSAEGSMASMASIASMARPVSDNPSSQLPPIPLVRTEARQTVRLGEDIDRAWDRQQPHVVCSKDGQVDPLGALIRARTIPLEPDKGQETDRVSNEVAANPSLPGAEGEHATKLSDNIDRARSLAP